jgi:hypothetical protein
MEICRNIAGTCGESSADRAEGKKEGRGLDCIARLASLMATVNGGKKSSGS